MQRGVIAAPGHIHPIPGGFKLERSLSPEELRYYALYWDKVVIPGSNLVYVAIPDEDTLIASGVIARPRVQFTGGYSGDAITRTFGIAQAVVAQKLIAEEESTDWVIHQFPRRPRKFPHLWPPQIPPP